MIARCQLARLLKRTSVTKTRGAVSPTKLSAPLKRARATNATGKAVRRDEVLIDDVHNNVTEYIFEKIGVDLHRRPEHPIGILKNAILAYFDEKFGESSFSMFDDLHPVVTSYENFDSVLVPENHVSRSMNDTYYVTKEKVLRCHTSAHQLSLLKQGQRNFLVAGDVYRRDSIDATHFPVFHQMEGVRVFTKEELEKNDIPPAEFVSRELKDTLEGLALHLFGDVELRWVDAYFPFTEPSYELEIFFKGEWLEVLGCGVMQQTILRNASLNDEQAWAFGLGLERLAMVLFNIPDIRLFWTDDSRFTKQFEPDMFRSGGKDMRKFKSYSKYPPCFKDVSFWLPDDSNFTENSLCEIVRSVAGGLAEEVKLIDEFRNPKTGKVSNCFRITYRSMDRSLTDEEINELQESVRGQMVDKLGVSLR
mmetsp:Transcript_2603/g.9447  ORF Transcript_2603/g.9447 Transcript_2603/m.9447 type:complete len:421 (-) Transcript_2603:741-2003(-)